MGCAACSKKHTYKDGYIKKQANNYPPYNANDISVYENGLIRRFKSSDWRANRHKLILLYPESNTPVCESEMGALNDWVEEFDKLDCDVFSLSTDHIGLIKQWHEDDESIKDPKYKALSSYVLPSRLGLLNGNKAKRASVIITKNDDVIIQEHFMKVGRSIEELHRQLYAYNTDSYCGESWTSPSDGFLKEK